MITKALNLASAGFQVFPVKKGTKGEIGPVTKRSNQLLKSWKKEATTDEEQIKKWWVRWPEANIGIKPGPGFIVIDVDAYKPEARQSLKDLMALGLPKDTMMVRTPRGGFHFYYKHPGGVIGNDNKDWKAKFPGIEIRADIGYAIGPGSVVNGKEYVVVDTGL